MSRELPFQTAKLDKADNDDSRSPGLTLEDVQTLNATLTFAEAIVASPPINATAEPVLRPCTFSSHLCKDAVS